MARGGAPTAPRRVLDSHAGRRGRPLLLAFQADFTEQMWGGRTWQALTFVIVESVLMAFGSVWLLGAARRHLARPVHGGDMLGRSASAHSSCRDSC